MTWRDTLKDSQKTSESNFPTISADMVLDIKENDKGNPAFRYWDKNKEENVFIAAPISGVYIGRAFRLSAFDSNFGKNGATYSSALYLFNSNITMFAPTTGSGKSNRFTGSKDEVSKWLTDEGVSDNPSVKTCILVATKRGLLEIRTSTTISIQQFNEIDAEVFLDNKITLTPSLYDPDDEYFTQKTKKMLGKFAAKNPPKYASISIGEEITDQEAESLKVLEHAGDFKKWKDWIIEKSTNSLGGKEAVPTESNNTSGAVDSIKDEDVTEVEDDLPF